MEGNQYDIVTRGHRMLAKTEKFPHQSFHAVSLYGISDPLTDRYA